jgi:predicted phage terminase large subunit-like protein
MLGKLARIAGICAGVALLAGCGGGGLFGGGSGGGLFSGERTSETRAARAAAQEQALIDAGLAEVHFLVSDPNEVAAGGSARLRAAGIRVGSAGPEHQAAVVQARHDLRGFLSSVTTGLPHVTLKLALRAEEPVLSPAPPFAVGELDNAACAGKACLFVFLARPVAKSELPGIVFQQEYEAQFVDMAGARVKREWLRHAEPPDKLDTIVMGVDLAISTRDGADYTAAVVMGRTTDGVTWVLAAERTRAGFHDVVNFVRAMAERYRPTVIAIEQVQYQAAVVQELLRRTTLPVRGVRPDKDKLSRFLPLEARYEQGLVWHAPGLRDFEDELLSFPEGAHDDLVDASAYAFAQLHKQGANQPELTRKIVAW